MWHHASLLTIATLALSVGLLGDLHWRRAQATELDCATDCREAVAESASQDPDRIAIANRPIYIADAGDTVDAIARRYSISASSIRSANEDKALETLKQGEEVALPWVPNVIAHADFSTGAGGRLRRSASSLFPLGSTDFIWPMAGQVSSRYGWRWGRMHRGIDVAGPVGTPIVAAMEGIVTYAGWDRGGYGNRVDIRHPNGWVTRYAHGSRVMVSKGDSVSQGEVIMTAGSTGRSTGPHLHFEIRRNGLAMNPAAFLGDTPAANDVQLAAQPLEGDPHLAATLTEGDGEDLQPLKISASEGGPEGNSEIIRNLLREISR
ncbi:M23 family metallopeptidase [Synechococcus sp. PCC 7336]|uniref:M23 family metallopeptidase n=1 Tax=Synechococcus sp. PCC 7336 TaxID=195250 RepID=UPI000348614C|nr:M23 family metallopeptidase [Synechococcus sp. PCC 7336]